MAATRISHSDVHAFTTVSAPSPLSLSPSSHLKQQQNSFAPTEQELAAINSRFADAAPQEILRWAIETVPGLYQTTAFGLTGLAALDMISKLSAEGIGARQPGEHAIPLIFLDTLYHFSETIELAELVSRKYGAELHVYRPDGTATVEEFEKRYGKELWKTDEASYDYLVKVEPARRAYDELGVAAVITGRRRSQGGERAAIPTVEFESGTGLIKINPLASWTFTQTREYIDKNVVPYNTLLDKGYSSIGDWHSTRPRSSNTSSESSKSSDADERAGRWAGRAEKTECGLHQDYLKMRMAFLKKQREKEQQEKDLARDGEL